MMNGRVLRKGLCRDFYGRVIIEHLRRYSTFFVLAVLILLYWHFNGADVQSQAVHCQKYPQSIKGLPSAYTDSKPFGESNSELSQPLGGETP